MHAGKQKRGTSTALHGILDAFETVTILDYGLTFDRTQPALAVHAFKRLGMPMNIATVLDSMWCRQERFLQLLSRIRTKPKHVDSSLLQGDPLSNCFHDSIKCLFTCSVARHSKQISRRKAGALC